MDINTERIILSLPEEKELDVAQKESPHILRKAAFIFCLILVMLSLAVHIGIGAAIIDAASDGEKTQSFLLAAVLPPYAKKKAFFEEEKTEEIHKDTYTAIPEDTSQPDTENPVVNKNSLSMDLSAKGEHGFSLKNETTYNPDLEILYNSPNPIEKTDKLYEKYSENEPLVLIYHTHATESYNDTNDTGSFRAADPERNMISVGNALAATLEANGIKTLHLSQLFDESSYNEAYTKSSEAVKKALEEYPSIRYILDIHRDSIVDESGNCISADFKFNELSCAQLMLVIGTDEGGSGHSEWRKNLTTALHLQDMLTSSAPSSMRPINLRKASFYQHNSAGAMLVEIGTCGNTLAEAKRSAVIFGHCLSKYITGTEPAKTVEDLIRNIE